MINKYFGINDGFGIVGYGYNCEKCNKQHSFVCVDDEEQECEICGHVNQMEPVIEE